MEECHCSLKATICPQGDPKVNPIVKCVHWSARPVARQHGSLWMEAKYPGITWMPCSTHCLALALEAWP